MVGWESDSCRVCADLYRSFLPRVRQANPVMLWRIAPVWKKDAKQQGSREGKKGRREDKMTRKKVEMKKEVKKHTEKYGKKQKASKRRKIRKSTRLFRVTFRKYFIIAGLYAQVQSRRHFGWQPSVSLASLTVCLPQSRDCSYYVSRQILSPPPHWLQKSNIL